MPFKYTVKFVPPKFKFSPFQKAWLADLAAGRFNQGFNSLAVQDGSKHVNYCCLGVACVVAMRMNSKLKLNLSRKPLGSDYDWTIEFDSQAGILPQKVKNALNLRDCQGAFFKTVKMTIEGQHYTFGSLVDMNDSERLTHKEIAAYIYANPENVFLPA